MSAMSVKTSAAVCYECSCHIEYDDMAWLLAIATTHKGDHIQKHLIWTICTALVDRSPY